jgi:hypothetical protein
MAANAERDAAIDAAIRDGKILARSRTDYVGAWDRDPAGTRQLLDRLVPAAVPVSDEPSGADKDGRHRAATGIAVDSRRDVTRSPLFAGGQAAEPQAAAAAERSGPAKVTLDASGAVTYRGFPVVTSQGHPCVFTPADWMTVEAFEASGMTEDDLALAQLAAGQVNSRAERLYRAGPSGQGDGLVRSRLLG